MHLLLGELISKSLMIGEHIYLKTTQVMSQNLKFKHHCFKLEVISWVVLLMHLMLFRSIRHNIAFDASKHNLGRLWTHYNM